MIGSNSRGSSSIGTGASRVNDSGPKKGVLLGTTYDSEEDVDGEEIDGEDIDGEDIDGEDIDGEDIDGEDIDGEDIDGIAL